MITEAQAWEQYNKLANEVRNGIVFQYFMTTVGKEFLFATYGLTEYPTVHGSNTLKGLIREEDGIKLLVENQLGETDTLTLYSDSIHLIDLLGVLENLEMYAKQI